MVDYETAFKKPFSDIKKLVIAILLNILPVVNFLTYGYFLEVAKSSGGKRPGMLPEWKGWGVLFINGFLALVIGFIYLVPLFVVFAIMATSAGLSLVAKGISFASVISGLGSWFIIIGLIGFALAYILPSAILSFAFSGKFSAAFKFGEIMRKALTAEYFVVWLVAMVYSAVLGALFAYIPFLGRAIAGAITGITMFSLLGEVYPTLGQPAPLKVKVKKTKRK